MDENTVSTKLSNPTEQKLLNVCFWCCKQHFTDDFEFVELNVVQQRTESQKWKVVGLNPTCEGLSWESGSLMLSSAFKSLKLLLNICDKVVKLVPAADTLKENQRDAKQKNLNNKSRINKTRRTPLRKVTSEWRLVHVGPLKGCFGTSGDVFFLMSTKRQVLTSVGSPCTGCL